VGVKKNAGAPPTSVPGRRSLGWINFVQTTAKHPKCFPPCDLLAELPSPSVALEVVLFSSFKKEKHIQFI